MAALDWVFVAVLLASMLLGAWRGLVFEVLSLLGWIAAFFVAQRFAADAAALLPLGGAMASLRQAAGFVLVFVAAVFVCGFLTSWIGKKLVYALGLRPADRSLGAAFGVLRGLVLLLALAVVAAMTPLHQSPWWRESRGVPVLAQAIKGLKPALPDQWSRLLPF